MATSARTRRTFSISFPQDLATQVERLAKLESRTTSELFREAFRAYRAQQLKRSFAELNAIGVRDNHKGYSAGDVEQLVHEDREARASMKRDKPK